MTTRVVLLASLVAALLTGAVWWMPSASGPDDAVYPVAEMPAEVLLVVDAADPFAGRVADQARFSLGRAKVPFDEADIAGPLPNLDRYAAVLTAAERLSALAAPDAARLAGWVEAGGGLGVLYRAWTPALAPTLGFASSALPPFVRDPETLRTAAPLMPGSDSLQLATGVLSSFDAGHQSGCVSLADRVRGGRVTGSGGWTCAQGEGRVVYWNHALFGTKLFRGHILQTLSALHPAHARPLARWAVLFLDDFPAPASNARLEPVWSRHGQTPAQFYASTWYPDMVALAEAADLTFTSTVIYAYNDRTRAPFPVSEWLTGRIQRNGAQVPFSPWIMSQDARRSEQALHGYNHQSLLTETWGAQGPMTQALRTARARWEAEGLAPLPTTYVPPMNLIDSVGVAALRAAFPEIETLASTYTGEPARGEGREFGPEPWAPEVYALPRNTAGYVFTDAERLKMLCVLHTVGAWNHFVHPDEPYANADRDATYRAEGLPPPSALGWDETPASLLPSLARWVGFAREHYPWLDGVAAQDATRRMRSLDALQIGWGAESTGSQRSLTVSASRAGQTVLTWARPGERLAAVEGGTVLDVWEGPVLHQYTIQADGPQVRVSFRPAALP